MPWKKLTEGISISQLAKDCGGELIGNESQKVLGICTLSESKKEHLAFTSSKSIIDIKKSLSDPNITALLTAHSIPTEEIKNNQSLIIVNDPQKALLKLLSNFFESHNPTREINDKASVHQNCEIGDNPHIGAFSSIAEGCKIGNNVTIHPNVTIYANVKIGNDCTIHSGAVIREECEIENNCTINNGAIIGSEGFGYFLNDNMQLEVIPQIGNVEIKENVDIGANTCIDRATLGRTLISSGTKIDNQVQIGHNTEIGQSAILCGQVGIAGSTKIGNGVVLGGQTGIADHLVVVENSANW